MLEGLSGATRLYVIVGDPIAQVKSPNGVTRALEARGRDAVVVPIHVTPADLDAFVQGASLARNLDGIIVTVPHKFGMYAHCAAATERAHFLRSVNILRRLPDGGWHGEMFDGLGFVGAQKAAGCVLEGRRALLVGAGGAGCAIALALQDAGVAELAIHDSDAARRDSLRQRLADRPGGKLPLVGSDDPTGFDVIANATPAGMRAGDAPPVQLDKLTPAMFVGDVITAPEVTPLLAAARAIGCGTQTGIGMFRAELDMMVEFLLGA